MSFLNFTPAAGPSALGHRAGLSEIAHGGGSRGLPADRSLGAADAIVPMGDAWGKPVLHGRGGIFETCANAECRTGWLHLWRNRARPLFEGQWCCSQECTTALVHQAVAREMNARAELPQAHRHRVPIGLLLLDQGWITASQLRRALEAQREAAGGRLGGWLMRLFGIREGLITRALALQWNVPVLHLDGFLPSRMVRVLPRLFVDAYGALPLRIAGGRILYLAFEERIDPILALALERMSGLKVECGILSGSDFQVAHKKLLSAEYPRAQLLEAADEASLSKAFARQIERSRAVDARLIRVHDCLWLRIRKGRASAVSPEAQMIEDGIASINL